MEDTLLLENQNKFLNSSLSSSSSSSHCWEPDGSFHSVCIFVITVSVVCGVITIISVYRIILLMLDMFRYFVVTSRGALKYHVSTSGGRVLS